MAYILQSPAQAPHITISRPLTQSFSSLIVPGNNLASDRKWKSIWWPDRVQEWLCCGRGDARVVSLKLFYWVWADLGSGGKPPILPLTKGGEAKKFLPKTKVAIHFITLHPLIGKISQVWKKVFWHFPSFVSSLFHIESKWDSQPRWSS